MKRRFVRFIRRRALFLFRKKSALQTPGKSCCFIVPILFTSVFPKGKSKADLYFYAGQVHISERILQRSLYRTKFLSGPPQRPSRIRADGS